MSGKQPARRGAATVGDDRYQPKLAPLLDAVAVEDVSVGEVAETKPERRKASVRRDLNDLVRSPDGKVSEAKGGAVLFKTAMLYIFVVKIDAILADWAILAIFVGAFVAPDLLKKIIATKAGVTTK